MANFRIGHGYDIHRTVPGRPLVLGGVTFDTDFGLDGHSDADALTHAICDALLGAAALPDIGHFFPNTDPAFKNIDSQRLLQHVLHVNGARLRCQCRRGASGGQLSAGRKGGDDEEKHQGPASKGVDSFHSGGGMVRGV